MARKFSPAKVWRRAIEFPSSDRAIPAAHWIVEITAAGVAFHRHGTARQHALSWRSIISHGLIHGAKMDRRITRILEAADYNGQEAKT